MVDAPFIDGLGDGWQVGMAGELRLANKFQKVTFTAGAPTA